MSQPGERRPRREAVRLPGGLTLRALVPNAITAAALASGLTGIRFAITAATGDPAPTTSGLPLDDWQKAVLAVILAGMLDGIDGRIARLLNAQSRFGAELDSLSDVISFGVAIYWVTCVEANPQGDRPGISEVWRRFPRFILGFVGASPTQS